MNYLPQMNTDVRKLKSSFKQSVDCIYLYLPVFICG